MEHHPTAGAAGIWLNTAWAGGDASKVYITILFVNIAAVGMPSSGFDDNAYGIVVLGQVATGSITIQW